MRFRLFLLVVILAATNVRAQTATVPTCQQLSLYCIQLIPTASFAGSSGHVELARPPSAFGVVVTRDGHHRFKLVLDVAGLPEPSSLGPYEQYILWAMPLDLDPVMNMGAVGNGHHELGEISFNKFMLLMTAEPAGKRTERSGPFVMRGRSPSARLEPHDLFQIAAFATPRDEAHDHEAESWPMPAMHPTARMLDAMMTLRPAVSPWLPEWLSDAPDALPREVLKLADGDSITLRAYPVIKTIAGRKHAMLGYNGQIPGPLLEVDQKVTINVTFINDAPFASSIHWHGLRHDNANDGVPGFTQDPVEPGETFEYTVHFPDAGIYWYHPHHREDAQQELGLYGNMIVRAPAHSYLPEVDQEEILVLDDFTIGPSGQAAFGLEESNFALMGRFGNQLLINGETESEFVVKAGSRVRWFVTNVSNTRAWNLSVEGHAMQIVASDLSPYEEYTWEESMTIAPAERYVADIYPSEAGRFAITNRIQSLDHTAGVFFQEVDTVGWFVVEPGESSEQAQVAETHVASTAQQEIQSWAKNLEAFESAAPDREVELLLRTNGLPPLTDWILKTDQTYFLPVEFSDTMPFMNWSASGREVEWLIREPSTGRENLDIQWTFELNSTEKIRITNRRDSEHAMQHPIHLHGQRFLVLSYNGRPLVNRVWKDTVLIPAGMTADILVEFTNPGIWMMHCHIAEHLEVGMKMSFKVE